MYFYRGLLSQLKQKHNELNASQTGEHANDDDQADDDEQANDDDPCDISCHPQPFWISGLQSLKPQ